MSIWRIILATVVIFGAGIVTGTLLMRQAQPAALHAPESFLPGGPLHPGGGGPNHEPPRFAWMAGMPPRGSSKAFLERLDAELKLTDTQREHIKKILDDGQDRTRECWKEIEPQVRKEIHDTSEKIRAELTPDQQAKFADLFKPKPHPRKGGDLERRETNGVSWTNGAR